MTTTERAHHGQHDDCAACDAEALRVNHEAGGHDAEPRDFCPLCVLPQPHAKDSDCDGHLDADDVCLVCSVYHGDPCPECSGRGYHGAECPEAS